VHGDSMVPNLEGRDYLFRVVVRDAGERTVVELHGELDLASVDALAVKLRELAPLRSRGVVIDLSHLYFLDCAGLRVLVDGAEHFAASGAEVVLLSPTPPVRRVLDLTGVSSELTIESPQ